MIIGKFNKFFARHGRAAFLVILLLIGIPFIFFFGVDTQAFTQNIGDTGRVAYVDDHTVSEAEFRRHLVAIELRSQDGNMSSTDFWRESAPRVFTRVHMLNVAREQGMGAVSDKEVQQEIQRIPFFQTEDGRFDLNAFRNFKNNYLTPRGLSAKDFDQIIRDDIVIGRLYRPYLEGFTVSDLEMRFDTASMMVEASGQIARFFIHDNTVGLEITDEEIQDYYETHKSGILKVPPRRQILVGYADAGEFTTARSEVTDEEIEAYYEANKEDYAVEKVRASHIEFRVPSDAPDDVRQERRELAEKVLAEVKQPDADFAELAEKYSSDRWSAKKGGDVGYFTMEQRQWAPAVFKLETGQIGDEVVESIFGFHIVKKTDQKDDYRDLSEVRNGIHRQLMEEKEEAHFGEQAKAYYEANRETEFNVREVNARHILIQADQRQDSPTALREKREKVQQILQEARTGADFGELAETHSEGPSGKDGGKLGWITKNGRMVPNFERAALATPTGQVSDVVTTQFGFHIIKVDEERMTQKEYEDVKGEIVAKLRREDTENARQKAEELVQTFLTQLYRQEPFIQADRETRAEAFRAYAETYAQEHDGFKVEVSEPFAADAASVPGIPGSTSDLVEAASTLTPADRVTLELVSSGNYFYVACLEAELAAYEPELDKDLRARIITELRDQKGLSVAREKAQKAVDSIRAALEEGKSFEEAKGDYEFEEVPTFSLMQGPQGHSGYQDVIVELASETPAGQISNPADYEFGVVIMYVEEQGLDTEGMEQQMSFMGNMYRNMMAQTMQGTLENQYASETEFITTRAWDWLVEEPTQPGGVLPENPIPPQ